jgi:hypothetical protein
MSCYCRAVQRVGFRRRAADDVFSKRPEGSPQGRVADGTTPSLIRIDRFSSPASRLACLALACRHHAPLDLNSGSPAFFPDDCLDDCLATTTLLAAATTAFLKAPSMVTAKL